MQKIKKVQVGIAGTGWVATVRHIPAFRRDPRATIVALYNPHSPKRAEDVSRKFNIPHTFSNLEAFLQQPFEVISICTPPKAHAALIEASLQAGKHVLVEKPMTMTTEEGQALDALAREKGLVLCPSHNFLFSRAMTQAKALLSQGRFGDVVGAMGLQWSSWRRHLPSWFPELPGGLFFDEAPHLLYLLRYFLGDLRVTQAWRTEQVTVPGEKLERFEARLEGQRGWGFVSMWFGAPMSEWLLLVSCTRGALVIDLFRDILLHFPPEQIRNRKYFFEVLLRGTFQVWWTVAKWAGTRPFRGHHLFGLDNLVRGFLDAVILGEEPPVSAREGWEVVSLIWDILQAAMPEKTRFGGINNG